MTTQDYGFAVGVPLTLAKGSLSEEQFSALVEHVREEALRIAKEYIESEVNPEGCWCRGPSHGVACHNHVVPY